MSTFFDLHTSHSYKMTGISTKRYAFYRGKPTEVEDASDIEKFRMHKDIFFECNEKGERIVENEIAKGAKSFVVFRPNIANRDESIDKSNKEVEEKRKAGIDVNALLDEVDKDTLSDDTADIDKIIKKISKIKKEKNHLECELCGYIATDLDDLRIHLDKHSEED